MLLLAIYSPSKLSQVIYSDMINLISDSKMLDEQKKFVTLPSPMKLKALFIPRRSYNFRLMGRVIEKMVEQEGTGSKWALTFKGITIAITITISTTITTIISTTITTTINTKILLILLDPFFEDAEDFHDTLLQVIRKYPQIVGLNFTNLGCTTGEESAKMGHLVGHIPSSVRFVNFNGGLSSERYPFISFTITILILSLLLLVSKHCVSS